MSKAGALHTVAGSTVTRRSPRTYTHAVVADYDQKSQAEYNLKWATEQAIDSWDYHHAVAKKNVGDAFISGGSFGGKPFTYDAHHIEESRTFAAAHPDRDAYIGGQAAAAVQRAMARPDGELCVLQWSMSERNAAKGMGKFTRAGIRNIRVVPVSRKG
jgi:hypothetical protein